MNKLITLALIFSISSCYVPSEISVYNSNGKNAFLSVPGNEYINILQANKISTHKFATDLETIFRVDFENIHICYSLPGNLNLSSTKGKLYLFLTIDHHIYYFSNLDTLKQGLTDNIKQEQPKGFPLIGAKCDSQF